MRGLRINSWRDFWASPHSNKFQMPSNGRVGKSYLAIAKGLLNTDSVLLDGARTFFGLTIDGSLELAQMAIAKLYDRTRGAVTNEPLFQGQLALRRKRAA